MTGCGFWVDVFVGLGVILATIIVLKVIGAIRATVAFVRVVRATVKEVWPDGWTPHRTSRVQQINDDYISRTGWDWGRVKAHVDPSPSGVRPSTKRKDAS